MGEADHEHLDPDQLVALGSGSAADAHADRHLVACDECWSQVRAARAGRLVAETLREVAPPGLRDRITAAAGCSEVPSGRRPRPGRLAVMVAAMAVVLVVLGAVGVVVRARRQDHSIMASVVASARAQTPPPAVLRQNHEVALMSTLSAGGAMVVVARLAAPMPMPPGAMPMTASHSPWLAVHGRVMVLCLDQPQPLLVAAELPADQLMDIARTFEAGIPAGAATSGGPVN